MVRCAIRHHLYNFLKKYPWRSVTLSKVATKSNTHPWVFFTFFKLYKWYQIAQSITVVRKYNRNKQHTTQQNILSVFLLVIPRACHRRI